MWSHHADRFHEPPLGGCIEAKARHCRPFRAAAWAENETHTRTLSRRAASACHTRGRDFSEASLGSFPLRVRALTPVVSASKGAVPSSMVPRRSRRTGTGLTASRKPRPQICANQPGEVARRTAIASMFGRRSRSSARVDIHQPAERSVAKRPQMSRALGSFVCPGHDAHGLPCESLDPAATVSGVLTPAANR